MFFHVLVGSPMFVCCQQLKQSWLKHLIKMSVNLHLTSYGARKYEKEKRLVAWSVLGSQKYFLHMWFC